MVTNNLEFLMRANRVNVSELARELDVSRGTIYRILDGGTPSARLMMKIAHRFNKQVNDVFCV